MAFWRLYYHLIWATSKREPMLTEEIEERLFPYLVHKASHLNMSVIAINGWLDHVHLVVAIPPSLAVADAVGRLKGASSHYLSYTIGLGRSFSWQRGYGALSLDERRLPEVQQYVARQKEHHQLKEELSCLEWFEEGDDNPKPISLDEAG
jgi:putative transposase